MTHCILRKQGRKEKGRRERERGERGREGRGLLTLSAVNTG